MLPRRSRSAALAVIAVALLVFAVDSPAEERRAAQTLERAALRMPFTGGGTTGIEPPSGHHRFWGGFAWDLHKGPGAPVRAQIFSTDGRVSLTVGTVSDSNGVGFRVPITVKVDGVTVGSVRFEHLVNVRVKPGPIEPGAVLGELPSGTHPAAECPGGRSHGFPWQAGRWEVCTAGGVHTHVELRQACWRPLGTRTPATANVGIAMLSSAFATSNRRACEVAALDAVNGRPTQAAADLILFDAAKHSQIWSIRPDGSAARRLLRDDTHPIEDPVRTAGDRVLFTRELPPTPTRRFEWTTWEMNVDGSSPRELSVPLEAINVSPSPDGRRLAFQRPGDGPAHSAIGVSARDGSGQRVIRNRRFRQGTCLTTLSRPLWTAARIVFGDPQPSRRGEECPGVEVAAMRPDGSGVRRLTRLGATGNAAWPTSVSADGRWISFARRSDRNASVWDYPVWTIWIMRSDGSGMRSLGFAGANATLSPDGSHVAFGRPSGLFVAPVDGSTAPRRIWRGKPWFISWR